MWTYYHEVTHLLKHQYVEDNVYHILQWILFSISCLQMIGSTLFILMIFATTFTLLIKLKQQHITVFESHWAGIVTQAVALLFTATIILANSYYNGQSLLCVASEGLEYMTFMYLF